MLKPVNKDTINLQIWAVLQPYPYNMGAGQYHGRVLFHDIFLDVPSRQFHISLMARSGKIVKRVSFFLFIFSFCSAINVQPSQLGGPESVAGSRYQPVTGTRGMVVSDDRMASEWGAEILRRGGNAIDAAIATAFVLAVTRPHYASLGGGGFLLFCPHPKSENPPVCHSIDFREKAPQAAKKDMFIRDKKAAPQLSNSGALASATPGTTAGLLLALEKFGTFSRQMLLTRPIEIAKRGYLFTTHSENAEKSRWPFMNDAAKQIFGCTFKGKIKQPCPPGERILQKDLAHVLETVSKMGRDGFYRGWVAKKIANGIQEAGGILTEEDLNSYQPKIREPMSGQFLEHEVISMPPPSSGGAIVLQLLDYALKADPTGAFKNGFGSADTIHALIHAMALSFADRAHYFGDPDFVNVPLSILRSPEYITKQWKTFDSDHAALPEHARDPAKEPQHTTHFSVIDAKGNAVAITTTVNENFGSGFVPPGTGIVMNDEMDDFSIQAGVPNLFGLVGGTANSIAPGKRPLSSMSPTIVRDQKGNVEIVIGAAGGPRIITSVFQSLFNRLKFGMSLNDAVAFPRFHQQWTPTSVAMERFGFSIETRSALIKKGYSIEEVPSLGKVHAIERLENKRVSGVADPRGEGAAVPE